jgi:hypothetical protein
MIELLKSGFKLHYVDLSLVHFKCLFAVVTGAAQVEAGAE